MKILIDVRTREEFVLDAAPGAINIPLDEILDTKGTLRNVSIEVEIGVYCMAGCRAEKAKDALNKLGYSNVTNLGGLRDVTRGSN